MGIDARFSPNTVADVERWTELDLSRNDIKCLVLYRCARPLPFMPVPIISTREWADKLGCDRTTITRCLNRLSGFGLIGPYELLRSNIKCGRPEQGDECTHASNDAPTHSGFFHAQNSMHSSDASVPSSDAPTYPLDAPMHSLDAPVHRTKLETQTPPISEPPTDHEEILDLDQSIRSIDQRETREDIFFFEGEVTARYRDFLAREAAKLPTPPANLEQWISKCAHKDGYQKSFQKQLVKNANTLGKTEVPAARQPEFTENDLSAAQSEIYSAFAPSPIALQRAAAESAAAAAAGGGGVPKVIEQGSEGILAMLRGKWNSGMASLRRSVKDAIAVNGFDWGIELGPDGPELACEF